MSVDTKTQRLSLINFGTPWTVTLPEPSGSVTVGDRLHFLMLYSDSSGTPAPEGGIPVVLLSGGINMTRRNVKGGSSLGGRGGGIIGGLLPW